MRWRWRLHISPEVGAKNVFDTVDFVTYAPIVNQRIASERFEFTPPTQR